MTLAGLAVLAAPLAEATPTMIRWGLAARVDMLWGGVTIGTLAAAALAIARGHVTLERTFPLVAVATALAAFASRFRVVERLPRYSILTRRN